MKYFIILLFLGLCACNSHKETTSTEIQNPSLSNAKIEFENKEFDFGTLTEGEVVTHSFPFTNVGTDPVEIFDIQVSCGCTVASKPEKPVGVGQKGEITIQFNSQGKVGANRKSVGVFSNAQNAQEILYFTADVKAKNQ